MISIITRSFGCDGFTDALVRVFTREQTADAALPPELSAASGNRPASSSAEVGPPYTPADRQVSQTDRQADRQAGRSFTACDWSVSGHLTLVAGLRFLFDVRVEFWDVRHV